jgi:hypothetical protein
LNRHKIPIRHLDYVCGVRRDTQHVNLGSSESLFYLVCVVALACVEKENLILGIPWIMSHSVLGERQTSDFLEKMTNRSLVLVPEVVTHLVNDHLTSV